MIEKIKTIITSPVIGMDAWYDSYMDDATELFQEAIDEGKVDECFSMLEELTTSDQKVRFFEAISDVHSPLLLPHLIPILETAEPDIAEPIIDGLREWDLEEKDLQSLKDSSKNYLGKSKVLDKVIGSLLKLDS